MRFIVLILHEAVPDSRPRPSDYELRIQRVMLRAGIQSWSNLSVKLDILNRHVALLRPSNSLILTVIYDMSKSK